MAEPKKNITVLVAMSGGVDSSVAAALLLEQGYGVIGVTMKTYNFDEVGGNMENEASCCGLDAFNDARMVAVKLGIPHYVLDLTEQFGREVIDNFVGEYLHGRTPNPCIICNKNIKWGELLKKADTLGAQYIATGHYARVRYDELRKRYSILRPRDSLKDQTYALWGLSQPALSRTMFPLGELTKPEVRKLAEVHGLKTATKDESFEICFVPDNDYRRFLKDRVPGLQAETLEGDLMFDGHVVGKHHGISSYTIGQRSGLGSYGEKVYVTNIDAKANTITIGRKDDLFHNCLIAKDVNLINVETLNGGLSVHAQVRYKDTPSPANVFVEPDGHIRIVFDQPKRAITPGQSVVFYDGDALVGGGVIERASRETP